MIELPLVTIAISTYNRANSYLPRALDSALSQTYPNLEVIVADNCSSDDTGGVVARRADRRVRYFRHEANIGPNNNFNFCLEQARGDYFLLLHDDDRIDPDFVESCIAAAGHGGNHGVIRTGTRIVDGADTSVHEVPNRCAGLSTSDLFLTWFKHRTAFYLCSTLFNTRGLREHGGFGSRKHLFQDVAAVARLAVRYGRVDVREVKASFRRHDDNKGSRETALDWVDDSLYLLDLLEELMPTEADRLRRAGLPYLCRKCYRNVRSIAAPGDRWVTYLTIYRLFAWSYSPWRYLLSQFCKKLRRSARRTFRSERSRSESLRTSQSRST
jgi:glycosyltransferase involved in cell wall biosynthesis